MARKRADMSGIMRDGKTILLAYDHGMEHGPGDFEDKSADPSYILGIARSAGLSGIILQKGVAEKYYDRRRDVPLVIKLNGKTGLYRGEPVSEQVCSVEEAADMGAAAVGYTIYLGSEYEPRMLEEFFGIEEQAHERGMPVIAWMYPRGRSVKRVTPKLVAYAARVGLEMGADLVKVKYTGSINSFTRVVKDAGRCGVLCLGGSKMSDRKFLKLARDAISSGASGMAVGRNIWQHRSPLKMSAALKSIVFEGSSVDGAMALLKDNGQKAGRS
jgi:class I fructose-bisphosphate aldolase